MSLLPAALIVKPERVNLPVQVFDINFEAALSPTKILEPFWPTSIFSSTTAFLCDACCDDVSMCK
jgi:hypothetical protein